jgi:hypothetical protein
MNAKAWRLGLAVAASVAATACGGGSTAGRMSVGAKAVVPATATASAASGTLDLGQGISVTRVRIAIARLKLEGGAAAPSGGGMDGMDDGSMHDAVAEDGASGGEDGEVKIGPFAVDLSGDALAGGVRQVFDSEVPAGTYRELSIEIAPVASLTALSGSSVVIDGTIDGSPFTFASGLAAVQKRELPITVAADGSSSRVTLTVDPKGWFVAPDGRRLDPGAGADRSAIEANVAASIDAFDDDDHVGADDGMGGGGEGPGHG